ERRALRGGRGPRLCGISGSVRRIDAGGAAAGNPQTVRAGAGPDGFACGGLELPREHGPAGAQTAPESVAQLRQKGKLVARTTPNRTSGTRTRTRRVPRMTTFPTDKWVPPHVAALDGYHAVQPVASGPDVLKMDLNECQAPPSPRVLTALRAAVAEDASLNWY